MLADRSNNVNEDQMAELKAAARVSQRVSSVHHYIPQYFIKGFTGSDGLLSVYDKKLDILKNNRVGPKGVFYEKDRHTVDLGFIKNSLIEDKLFADMDSFHAPHIKRLQKDENALTYPETEGAVASFIIDLFWRNPISDHAFEKLYAESTVTLHNGLTGEPIHDAHRIQEYKNDPVNIKLQRAQMFLHATKHIQENRISGTVFSSSWKFYEDQFVIGDYPMLFEYDPATQKDLFTMNYILPVSSKKVYVSSNQKIVKITIQDAHLLMHS